ncbi:hypothetical protein GLAREA_00110 [Glarea lozoyensis ATCC 20868]|uniref:Uncharacterized protein n=1 Tax=Glarea lozoyensis (strain ATCC 20868 / MF5171) TaxID=1116229 RepID=S3CR69_GLAL2|nr:uncharacterized protein GLAREA_00110 [Glarea lozoyensis ATCC 20868]EPE28952.1 hypothetical protein GLAREA_00110 [Glarea lozoyensis ATCC 20868]
MKASRACRGYECNASILYEIQNTQSYSHLSAARKCSLPLRVSIPGTNLFPEDAIPLERSEEESNWLSFRAFLYDFCVTSTNSDLSRGYLHDVEALVGRLGPASDLVKACQAVSFSCHGKVLRRPNLVYKSERLYQEVLGSFAKTINDPILANTTESKLVALLLGLYQIAATTESSYGEHLIHANGLAALLKIGQSPLSLLGTMGSPLIQGVGIKQNIGVFSASAFSNYGESLESILLQLSSVWNKSEAVLEMEEVHALKNEITALDGRFINWQKSRIQEIQPTTIGHVEERQHVEKVQVGFWPGKIDTYFDFCVAGMWNVFRAARLLLTLLGVKLCDATGDIDGYAEYKTIANEIAKDIAASIAFHLTDNLHVFVNELETSSEIREQGRLLGGVLLMHPLYVATQVPYLQEELREYMRSCLEWIGSEMGLGQATLLAKVREIDARFAYPIIVSWLTCIECRTQSLTDAFWKVVV